MAGNILNNIPNGQPNNSNPDNSTLVSIEQFRQEFNAYTEKAYGYYDEVEGYLKDIAEALRSNGIGGSASAARQRRYDAGNSFRDPYGRNRSSGFNPFDGRGMRSAMSDFSREFKKELFDALIGSKLKDTLRSGLKQFAKELGTNISDLPKTLARNMASEILKTKTGGRIFNKINQFAEDAMNSIFDAYRRGSTSGASPFRVFRGEFRSAFTGGGFRGGGFGGGGFGGFGGGSNLPMRSPTIPTQFSKLGLSTTGTGSALSGIAGVLGRIVPPLMKFYLILKAVELAMSALKSATNDLAEGWKEMKEALKKSAMRDIESRKKQTDAEKRRLEDDVRTLIEEPFKILKEAAEEIYSVWDSQLRTITATQGYNKSDLQDLMAVYAQRLRDEGLTSVVSGASITENLAKVLESGLSGKVAEEFAYIATILNNAIPTQDFFTYGQTYASLAANAIAQGKSQEEAIAYANKELQTFASSVLYASRELTGGFTTGLKDASDLFTKSVQITQAAKTGDASRVAGVLTAVAGITGALAPDLASTMVESVVKAATGGNASDVVALRSLAGINASNTEFLKALATDPQKIFATLFTNLAKMQNMSNDAFMEVAEGLSSVFGVSMDAFARLDFTQLAKAISNMNTSDESLNQNMELLISGQTTTTAEQLKMQQINQYMIEEGLSYVVDNAAARMIQEHMWQEQQTRAITEAEYGVNIIGGGLSLLTGIYGFVEKVLMILNPFYGLFKVLTNVVGSSIDAASQRTDVERLLLAGQVKASSRLSSYSQQYFKRLTSTGEDLNITSSLLELMGVSSAYKDRQSIMGGLNSIWGTALGLVTPWTVSNLAGTTTKTSGGAWGLVRSPKSAYSWGNISKSVANYVALSGMLSGALGSASTTSGMSASSAAQSRLQGKIGEMLADEYMREFIGEDKGGYAAWQKSASKFGITNLAEAIKAAGYAEEDIREKFEQQQAQEASRAKLEREHQEENFWDDNIKYNRDMTILMNNIWGSDRKTISDIYHKTSDIYSKTDEFMKAWVDYFVLHTAYNKSVDYSNLNKVLLDKDKNTSDAIFELADALMATQNLEDPQLQTNVLLAQILKIIQFIMTKQSNAPTFTLDNTFQGLTMGIIS